MKNYYYLKNQNLNQNAYLNQNAKIKSQNENQISKIQIKSNLEVLPAVEKYIDTIKGVDIPTGQIANL